MAVKVLVVDDSGFFRRRVTEILAGDPQIQVVGTATNGKEAIEQTLSLRPDVITMDYEMPVMDGITAVKQIMQRCPTPVIMFSSLTYEGARVSLDALDAGAADYLPKNFEDISRNPDKVRQLLCERVNALARTNRRSLGLSASPAAQPAPHLGSSAPRPAAVAGNTASPVSKPAATAPRNSPAPRKRSYKLVAIGTSTGGPVALQKVLTQLPSNFPAPLLLIQHMPAAFTNGRGVVRILPGDERLNYKPCVDVTFGSAAKAFQDKVLAVVLTGMGADGREGARMLKQAGSSIWAQDEASCVIYGMPMAIAKANLADGIYSLDEIGRYLAEIG